MRNKLRTAKTCKVQYYLLTYIYCVLYCMEYDYKYVMYDYATLPHFR